MKLGLLTPVVSLNPRSHNEWEREAGIDEIATIAVAADAAGYHHLTCSEHIAVPTDVDDRRGTRYWDPLATFGYLAGCTTTIRFATHVLVLGYHHPLDIAKRYGTLDQVCRGRLILGVGVGSLEEEFGLLDAPFSDRGARADDALRALRASFGQREPTYHGTHYDFAGFTVDPSTTTPDVPIWIGGRSRRSLRRAVELGDAWVPFGVSVSDVASWLADARETEAWQHRTRPLELGLWPEPALDPRRDAQRVADMIARYESAGATFLHLRFASASVEDHVEQLQAMAALTP